MEASLHFAPTPDMASGSEEGSLASVLPIKRRSASSHGDTAKYQQVHGIAQVPGCAEETPWTLNVPYQLDSPLIHFIVPGFGGFKRSSRELRNGLAGQENFATLSFEPVRWGGRENDLRDSQKAHIDTIPAILQSLPESRQLRDTANGDALDMGQTVMVPHSMGGIPAIEHAVTHPDEVAHMVLMAIVGLEGGKVGLGYLPRLVKSGQNEVVPAITHGAFGGWRHTPHMARCAVRYYLGNPLRTVGEMASLYQVDLRPKLAAIGSAGVGLAIYNFELDELVHPHKSIDASGKFVHHTEVAEGLDHLAPQTHPLQVAAHVGRISRQLSTKNATERRALSIAA